MTTFVNTVKTVVCLGISSITIVCPHNPRSSLMPCSSSCDTIVCLQCKTLPPEIREGIVQIIQSFFAVPDGQPQIPEAPLEFLRVLRHPRAQTDPPAPVHASSTSSDQDQRDVA
jgi:hypothetical protein